MTAQRRWLVDGMNVVGSRPDRWWRDRRRAMRSLVGLLAQFVREHGEPVTVVFDGQRPPGLPTSVDGVRVEFARELDAGSADAVIAALAAGDPDPATLTVVTSDRELGERVTAAGAEVVSAGSFRSRLERR